MHDGRCARAPAARLARGRVCFFLYSPYTRLSRVCEIARRGCLCDRTRSVSGRRPASGSPGVPPCLGRTRRGARRRESRGSWRAVRPPSVRQPPRTAGPAAKRVLARARRRGRGTWRHSRGRGARRSSRRLSRATTWCSRSTRTARSARGARAGCQGGVLGIGSGTELEVGARKGVRDRAGDRVGVRG